MIFQPSAWSAILIRSEGKSLRKGNRGGFSSYLRSWRFVSELHSYIHYSIRPRGFQSQLLSLKAFEISISAAAAGTRRHNIIQIRAWTTIRKAISTNRIDLPASTVLVLCTQIKSSFAGTAPNGDALLCAGWLARSRSRLVTLDAHLRHVLESEK